jgi:hypothetical protein
MYICNGYDIMRQEMLILIHLQTQTQDNIDTGSYKHHIELGDYRRNTLMKKINKPTNKDVK